MKGRNGKSHLIQTIAIYNSQLENVHKKSSKISIFHRKKSVVWLLERVNNV